MDDLVDAIELSLTTKNIGGHVFQIATNKENSVQGITDIITKTLVSDYGVKDIKIKYGNERPGDVQRNYSDVTKARNLLGWQNKIGIEEGIKRTIKWFWKELNNE